MFVYKVQNLIVIKSKKLHLFSSVSIQPIKLQEHWLNSETVLYLMLLP